MGFVSDFKKNFRDEMRKQARPHIYTALANALANQDIDVHAETLDELTDDFFFYFRMSAKSK